MMLGYMYINLYSIFTAISVVFIDKLGDNINPCVSLLFMATIATLFFIAINYKNLNKMWNACITNKLLYLAMSIATGINWLCSIFAPHLADPFLYLSMYLMTSVLLGLVFIHKKDRIDLCIHSLGILILVGLIIFVFLHYDIHSGKSSNTGLVLGILGGISIYLYGQLSNKLAIKATLMTTQVLGIRFIVLIISLAIFIASSKQINISFSFNIHEVLVLVFMAFLSLIIPIYFLQESYRRIGVSMSLILCGFIPLLTCILYSIISHRFIGINFMIAGLITLTLIITTFIPKFRKEK